MRECADAEGRIDRLAIMVRLLPEARAPAETMGAQSGRMQADAGAELAGTAGTVGPASVSVIDLEGGRR